MTHPEEHLPRPEAALNELADYYDANDTSAHMEGGQWVEPGRMVTTSLRLPADVINELKRQAQASHVRYTTYIRAILERAANGSSSLELADITERLKRIERAVSGDHKTA
jgi:predicted DNA-binding protein